jgi:hypothetical protein
MFAMNKTNGQSKFTNVCSECSEMVLGYRGSAATRKRAGEAL